MYLQPIASATLEQVADRMLELVARARTLSAFVLLADAKRTVTRWNSPHDPSADVLPVIAANIDRYSWMDFPHAGELSMQSYNVVAPVMELAGEYKAATVILHITDGTHRRVAVYLRDGARDAGEYRDFYRRELRRILPPVEAAPAALPAAPVIADDPPPPAAVPPAAVATPAPAYAVAAPPATPVAPASAPKSVAEEPAEIVTSWETRPKRRAPIRTDRPASVSPRKRGRPPKPKG